MKKMRIRSVFIAALVVLSLCFPYRWLKGAGLTMEGGEPHKKQYQVPKIDAKIDIDGVLDDPAWQDALKLEIKYEIYPGENIEAPVKTEVFLAYSQTTLYAGFRAYDPDPSQIRARYTDRDNIWGDDRVAIILDPFNEHNRRFSFFCNPLGIQAEIIENLANELIPWDAIWSSAGKITDFGYVVEMAIPFSSLRFPRKSGDQEQVWGFDVMRTHLRDVRHYLGHFPRDRNNSCYMCQADQLVGIKGVKPGRSIEIDPTLTAVLTQERESFPDGKFVKKDSKLDPGITARWNVTPNMAFGAAINPDFSNIEADSAQLDINTQFALYYPEKRPFFLEGATIFKPIFGDRLPIVYTRTLADPNWGIKLTGKEKGNDIGIYTVQDNITNLLFPGAQQSTSAFLDMKTLGTVLRYSRDLGGTSSIGLFVTDREGKDYYNRLAGVDAHIQLTKSDEVQVQAFASQTRYPNEIANLYQQPTGKFQGSAVDVFYRHQSRNVTFKGGFLEISPEFRADLGFVTQTGFRQMTAGFDYSFLHNPGHWYTLIQIGPSFEYQTDDNDNLLFKSVNFNATYNGPLQTTLTLTGAIGERAFMGNVFDINEMKVSLDMFPSANLEVAFEGTFGDNIDVNNVRAGNHVILNPAFAYNLGRHLSLLFSHKFERFNIPAGRLFTANISYLRFLYHLNHRAFFRAIVQYVHHDYNTTNYLFPIDPLFKRLFSQLLFSYKLNARTVLFLGYSDDYYGFQGIPLTQNNRTFFLKVGYALEL